MERVCSYQVFFGFGLKAIGMLLLTLTLQGRAQAQQDLTIKTVYINDRSFYTGVVVEADSSEQLIIVTTGGYEYTVGKVDVDSIVVSRGRVTLAMKEKLGIETKKVKRAITYHNHGYFALIQYFTGYAHMGVTTVHGYKFNQYLHLGLGAGFDGVQRPISFRPKRFYDKYDNAMGMHLPFFAYIGGDFLQKRATPYYAIEVGYAYASLDKTLIDLETRSISPHGFSIASSFGVKFNSHRSYHTNVGLKLTYRGREMTFREVILDEESNLYHLEFNRTMTSSWFFGLTVVQGF